MTPFRRYILQLLVWIGIWCAIWLTTGDNAPFIRVNGPTFILQNLLLIGLIFVAVPQVLMKNKLIYFLTLVCITIVLFSIASTAIVPNPTGRPSVTRIGRAPPLMESRFFVQLLIMSITCISAVLIETFIFAQQKERSEAIAKAELMESELKFLKMQINPHFLFNALNNIYSLSVTNSVKTQDGISRLSKLLRYVLYDCERPEVPLYKELEYITHFIQLFKLKSSEGFNISFVQDIESDTLMIAPMLFVPFIENAFKHSGIENRGDTFVNIALKAKKNAINFTVENSLPTKELFNDQQGGIGIQNVKKRLDILYPQHHKLEIVKENTFRIHLIVELT